MLAIAGGKGGCGKTTTTLGLADALSRRGLEPLVVDADCDMPDLHHRGAVPREPGVDALAAGSPLEAVVHQSAAVPGVAVVPAGRRRHLGVALGKIERWHGPVLIDCAAGANPDSLLPLRHADTSVVVSTDTPQCLEDTADTVRAARQLDAGPLGIIIRDSGDVSTAQPPPNWRQLAHIPSVDKPLSDTVTREMWSGVSELILGLRKHERKSARTGCGHENHAGG
jgi:septum site-determining protein MinD